MADLMDQHVANDVAQVLVRLAPIVEDRPAVEIDHVTFRGHVHDALARQVDAPVEAQQIEGRLAIQVLHGLVVGEIDDLDDHLAQRLAQLARDRRESLA